MWSIPRTLIKFWALAHFKLSYLLNSKNTDFGWILAVKLGSKNDQVGPKSRLGPKSSNFFTLFLAPKKGLQKQVQHIAFPPPPGAGRRHGGVPSGVVVKTHFFVKTEVSLQSECVLAT